MPLTDGILLSCSTTPGRVVEVLMPEDFPARGGFTNAPLPGRVENVCSSGFFTVAGRCAFHTHCVSSSEEHVGDDEQVAMTSSGGNTGSFPKTFSV